MDFYVKLPNYDDNSDSHVYNNDHYPVNSVVVLAFVEPVFIILDKINFIMRELRVGKEDVHSQLLDGVYRMLGYYDCEVMVVPILLFIIVAFYYAVRGVEP